MKTMLILILLTIFPHFYAQEPAQWNDKINTYIIFTANANFTERIAAFSNHYGVHVLKTMKDGPSPHVKYYRLTTEGGQPEGFSTNGIMLDTQGDFPNIVGDEEIMYAVYKTPSKIRVKYSTDGGENWSSINDINFSNGDVNCNGVDAAYSDFGKLHVVWSEKFGNDYESYFYRFNGFNWVDYFNLTNTGIANSGGFPTVTTSYYNGSHKTHITINTGNADVMSENAGRNYTRDFNYLSWSNPTEITPVGDLSRMDRLLVTEDGLIHSFYITVPGFPYPPPYMQYVYRKKHITASMWDPTSERLINENLGVINGIMHKIQVVKRSVDVGSDQIHAFWWHPSGGLYERNKNSSEAEWTSDQFNVSIGGTSFMDAAVTSVSNDLYALWMQYNITSAPIQFRHYDDKPSSPTNLTIVKSPQNHPYLAWEGVFDPDFDYYIVERLNHCSGGWQTIQLTTALFHEDQTLSYCTAIPPARCEDECTYYYRIRAVDKNSHQSEPSNTDDARLTGGGHPSKMRFDEKSTHDSFEYSLAQNYPNPFNPFTTINYSIKSSGLVTLKVYDMLGNEVDNLVDEIKEPGTYSTTLNSSNLPSGIYVYRLSSGNFVSTKKLMLLK